MLKKTIGQLSKEQRSLLLEVWCSAHVALTKERQAFTYEVHANATAEWNDLIDAGYIKPISGQKDRFILTIDTEGIDNELMSAAVIDNGGGKLNFQFN